jgi:hypothetical protein
MIKEMELAKVGTPGQFASRHMLFREKQRKIKMRAALRPLRTTKRWTVGT